MYERILVPLEKAGGSEAHLRHAVTLASKVGAEVILLRVITVVPSEDYFFRRVQVEIGSSGAKQKTEAEAYLAGLEGQLRERGVAVEPVVLVSDKPEDDAIVAYAAESNSQLIVLPNQRRSLVSRWLQGNVPAKVQRRSHIPILLVKDEDESGG